MKSEPHDTLSTTDMVVAGHEPPAPPADHVKEPVSGAPRVDEPAERPGTLLPSEEGQELRQRWDTIQTGFVDEPRRAVQDADGLVAQTMTRVAEVFAQERSALEKQWTRGENVSTEDLRVALKRYRFFFDRLLAA